MKQKDRAPDFTLPDDDGEPRRLSELLRSGPVVLFFYPAAMTPGCTAETCHFRDLASEFAELGAQPVGVSPDPVDRQRHFSEAHGIGFPLLSDVDGTVAARVRRGWPVAHQTAYVRDRHRSHDPRRHPQRVPHVRPR